MSVEVAVLIMTKAARAGTVKTRLDPLLGPRGCARLQAGLLQHTVLLAESVAPTSTYVAVDPPDAAGELIGLLPAGVAVLPQCGPDLGARMCAAATRVLERHHGPLLVIGTDAPTLTAAHLEQAGEELVNGRDVVFGPAMDGGYYLVGMAQVFPDVFAIDPGLWGGPEVLTASVARARAAQLQVGLLPVLRDLDTPQDAAAFLAEDRLPEEIAALLDVRVRQ
jgi:rSAM/selenodomain-associated transferase 1